MVLMVWLDILCWVNVKYLEIYSSFPTLCAEEQSSAKESLWVSKYR